MFYCPDLARFLAKDMIRRPTENPYLYGSNDSVNRVDPTGLQDAISRPINQDAETPPEPPQPKPTPGVKIPTASELKRIDDINKQIMGYRNDPTLRGGHRHPNFNNLFRELVIAVSQAYGIDIPTLSNAVGQIMVRYDPNLLTPGVNAATPISPNDPIRISPFAHGPNLEKFITTLFHESVHRSQVMSSMPTFAADPTILGGQAIPVPYQGFTSQNFSTLPGVIPTLPNVILPEPLNWDVRAIGRNPAMFALAFGYALKELEAYELERRAAKEWGCKNAEQNAQDLINAFAKQLNMIVNQFVQGILRQVWR